MNFADLIIHNARIITMDDLQPFAEALAIRGNRIMRVGQNAAVMELCGSKTRVIDNHGNTVIPGIIESHVHLFIGSVELDALNIRDNIGFDSIAGAVKDYRQKNPDLKIINAVGAAHEQFGAGIAMTRQLLDAHPNPSDDEIRHYLAGNKDWV